MWMLPLYLHVNQKPDYDDMIYDVNVEQEGHDGPVTLT